MAKIVDIKFATPYFSKNQIEEIKIEVGNCLNSGILTNGKYVKRLENYITNLTSSKYAVAVNSATAGLHSVLSYLVINSKIKSPKILVQANTFASSAMIAQYTGASVKFIDIETDSWSIDPKIIENEIDNSVVAIVVVHLAGVPAKIRSILDIASKKNIPIIEDCAHSHNCKYDSKFLGTFGIAGIFSYYPSKTIPGPEGGIIITNDHQLYEYCIQFRNIGRPQFGPYLPEFIGFNYRMNELQAIVIYQSYQNLEQKSVIRNSIVSLYKMLLTKLGFKFQIINDLMDVTYYSALVLVPDDLDRSDLISHLSDNNINSSILYPNLMEKAKLLNAEYDDLKNTIYITSKVLALPLHEKLSQADVEYIFKIIKDFIEG